MIKRRGSYPGYLGGFSREVSDNDFMVLDESLASTDVMTVK